MGYLVKLKHSYMFRARKKGKKSNPVLEGNIFTTSEWGKTIYNMQCGGKIYPDVKPESIQMNTGVSQYGWAHMYVYTGDIVKVFKGPGDIYHDVTAFSGSVEYYNGTFGVIVIDKDIEAIDGFDKFVRYTVDTNKYIIPLIDIISKGYKLRVIG